MSSDCRMLMNDRESWLTSVVPHDADAEREMSSLLGTAALVRGALQAIPVPEGAESASHDLIARLEEHWRRERPRQEQRRPWPSPLGSWLRVVFTLWRRR